MQSEPPPIRVRAPATTANIGPGFDCAGAALDLWNELELSPTATSHSDRGALGVRGLERSGPAAGRNFRFVERIPRARGLGSSASMVALGLVAACVVGGREPTADELLALGIELEGHGDNLAAALTGGVCLTWGTRSPGSRTPRRRRRSQSYRNRVETARRGPRFPTPSRTPTPPSPLDTPRCSALHSRATRADLFEAALDDRLHEPYRAESSPLLAEVRARAPHGALGATFSGAGPTVLVWARNGEGGDACADELRRRFPNARVLPLTSRRRERARCDRETVQAPLPPREVAAARPSPTVWSARRRARC